MKPLICIIIAIVSISILAKKELHIDEKYTNKISEERMLIVLSAPSIHNEYYREVFEIIVDFQINYAKKIIGNDNVVIIVDADTKAYFEDKIPEDILIPGRIDDIWMRDFTTINPFNPIQFRYTWASMSKKESENVQNSFNDFANLYGIERTVNELILDGGNVVDNYAGKIITTTRFLEDNQLSYKQGEERLKKNLNATEVAIIEPDEKVLAHSDGMVSWADDNILLINDYSNDNAYRNSIMRELRSAFPNTIIVEVPVANKSNSIGIWEEFESACGINLNSTVTLHTIYVPVFGIANDKRVINIIRQNTSKKIVEINAEGICEMGGSVRCLSWQLAGENASKLITLARNLD